MMIFAILIVACLFASVIAGGHKCGDPTLGPVIGGIDFVDFKDNYERTGNLTLPAKGSNNFVASLGNYKFWFKNSNNLDKFNANPNQYYPQLGGYCSWGLTGYDLHVTDPSGFSLAGACVNSFNGFDFIKSESMNENFWFLKYEAKHDMELAGAGLDANIASARVNFKTILTENSVDYCFNTDLVKFCQ